MSEEHTEADGPEPARTGPNPENQELRREVADFVKLVFWFLIIFLALRTYVIEGYEVQGPSMIPNLENNERILVLKLPHILSKFTLFRGINAISPGDIVVFDSPSNPNKRYVKRVIAMGPKSNPKKTVGAQTREGSETPGAISVRFDRGKVYVNNHLVREDYLRPDAKVSSDVQELKLGTGEYYVLGDNRPVSKDSRSFDAIHDSSIIGRAILRFWPPQRIGLLK